MLEKMMIDLTVFPSNKEISVACELHFDHAVKELAFYLHKDLVLDTKHPHERSEGRLELRSEVTRHRLALATPSKTPVIHYSGTVDGWMNTIAEDFISLNLYSAWFPVFETQDLRPLEKEVRVHGIDGFDLVNGEDAGDHKLLRDDSFDCIIFAGEAINFERITHDTIQINLSDPTGLNLSGYIKDILNFYSKTMRLPPLKGRTLNIVINPHGTGGFNREHFIVLSEDIPDDPFIISRFLAHEIGHFWAVGADTTTYHDWLNESFAELLALLYVESKFPEDEVVKYCDKLQKIAKEKPAIRTPDGSRPDGVHVKGVSLFIDIWNEFGRTSVLNLLHAFISLEEKTTNNFLASLPEQERAFIQARL